MSPDERQAVLDDEHLRLLALFHYISGAMTLAFSLFFGAWMVFMGALFTLVSRAEAASAHLQGPPAMFFAFFALLFLLGTAYGVLEVLSGRFMSQRRRWLFSFLVALPRVLFIPYGAILTIFTLLELDRPSVKQLYGKAR